jgi:hypothetical protein
MASAPSAAESFYRQIAEASDSVAFLNGLVTAHTQEEEWLEFKGATDPTSGSQIPDATISKYWSKAMSGFANTGGGVLIWGIDARQDPTTGIDGANALNRVPNPPALKLRLNQLLQHATDPPVIGIVLHEYSDPGHASEGFVVCYVPESSFKPHRAERCEGKPYYIRVADRFEIAPHSLLRYMFFPESHARFELDARLSWEVLTDGVGINVGVEARLKNVGERTAHQLLVHVRTNPALEINPYHPFHHVEPILHGWHPLESSRAIHPGFQERLFSAARKTGTRMLWVNGGATMLPSLSALELEVRVYSVDERPQVCVIRFDEDDIVQQVSKTALSEPA